MRKFLVTLVLLLGILSLAQEKPMIVIYQMEIVELSEETVLKLGLKEGNFEKDTVEEKIFGVVYDPKLMELLLKMPLTTLKIDLGKSNKKEKKVSKPWIATVPGKEASLLVGKERLSTTAGIRSSSGIKISVMPLNIEKDGSILTKVSLTDLSGSSLLKTQVQVPLNEFVPVSIVSVKNKQNILGWTGGVEKERKYFAFFIKASLVKELPKENIYSIGTIDELIKEFWKEGKVFRDNHLTIVVGLDMSKISTSFEFFWWLTDDWRMEITGSLNSEASFKFGMESRLLGEDLRMGGFLLYGKDNEFLVALGFSDQTRVLPNVTLHAGWYPLVFDPIKWEIKNNIWRVGAQILDENIALSLNLYLSGEEMLLSTEVGVRIYKSLFLVAGLEHNLKDRYRITLGIRWQF